MERLEDRTLPASHSLATAETIRPTDSISESVSSPGEADFFQVTVADTGRLTARLQAGTANALSARLSLLGPDCRLLIQSDGQSPTDPGGLIAQHVVAGTYFLEVKGLGSGTGAYTLTTAFQAASPPLRPLPLHTTPADGVNALEDAVGDLNGDGIPDLVTANNKAPYFSVLLGLGDGTFQKPVTYATGSCRAITLDDFNRDGHLDVAAANLDDSKSVSILLGRGDGTFLPQTQFPAGGYAVDVIAADFNGDGRLDLATADTFEGADTISVLLGRGDGTFRAPTTYPAGGGAESLVTGDLGGGGRLDLVVGNTNSSDISVLLGNGDGTFQRQVRYTVGIGTGPPVLADFNGDGHLDLVSPNTDTNDVSALLGNGDGTFQAEVRYPVGPGPSNDWGFVVGDFNGDGRADLVTGNTSDSSLLLGRGDGTFEPERRFGAGLSVVIAGDFNRDGRLDLVATTTTGIPVILLGLGDGSFQTPPVSVVAAATAPRIVVSDDFNGDGIADLATANNLSNDVSVLLGRPDGTFQNPLRIPLGFFPEGSVSADFSGDHVPDLAIAGDQGIVDVLLGNADGTFQPGMQFPAADTTGSSLGTLVVGDFNGDGRLDLATEVIASRKVSVLLGNGDGTFQAPVFYAIGVAPDTLIVGDFNGDGRLDLATGNYGSVSVLLGNGDGTFRDQQQFTVAAFSLGLVTGDFNGDGRLDLAISSEEFSTGVSVLLGKGDGSFQSPVLYAVGTTPSGLLAADYNGDGIPDLVVANSGSNDVSVLVGKGDGTFEDEERYALGRGPQAVVAGDFNRDGRLDLATANPNTDDVSVLVGRGDGTFQDPARYGVGSGPVAVVTGDFNGDGITDRGVVNPVDNTVSVSTGRGDGTFQDPVPFNVGSGPAGLVAGDFNRDGRLDLATANLLSNDVSVLLGLGDGSFAEAVSFPVGNGPAALVAGDFNGDGLFDLAVADSRSHDVWLLLGNGNGTFRSAGPVAAGGDPSALVSGDFNGDGHLDLAAANPQTGQVSVLLGRGDGSFRSPLLFAAGADPVALVAGDLNGDGVPDLAAADEGSDALSVLLGRGDGTFAAPVPWAAGKAPRSLVLGDFNGDRRPDLASADAGSNDVSFLPGRGDGTFAGATRFVVGEFPVSLSTGDFNSDDQPDLATADQQSGDVSTLIGLGDGTFVAPGTVASAVRSNPLVGDLNGDGVPEVAVLNQRGQILLRLGRPDEPGAFAPPVIVNPDANPARDLALVRTGAGLLLVALDARGSGLSLYARQADGSFRPGAGPVVPGTLAVRLAAADLNGDGRDDLVVVTAGSRQAFVYLQNAAGGLGAEPDYRLAVGVRPSDLQLVDVDGDGRPDIVVTNQFSGDVSVFLDSLPTPFSAALRFRAGTGLYGLDSVGGTPAVRSLDDTAGVIAGRFDEADPTDLVVTDGGTNSFSLLRGTGHGGFWNAVTSPAWLTGVGPTVVAAGDFNRDGHLDLATLNQGGGDVSVFLGDGHGGFAEKSTRDASGHEVPLGAGNAPTGLTVADVNGDGLADLLVRNAFGDVLVLLGEGDGTFQPYQRTDRHVALAVADLNGDGTEDFVFASEALDQVSVQYSRPGQSFSQGRRDGILAPGAVQAADLNGDGIKDLVVANSGANDVLVYPGLGDGQFGKAQTFFTGTDPTGITVGDLNGDGVPDLVVADQGSNDVTLLVGQGQGASWTLAPGPRLQTGGVGPVSTTVADVTGPHGVPDGIPDLLVANSQSNNFSVLPGVGQGFFNDQNPRLFSTTGSGIQKVVVAHFRDPSAMDLVTVNAGSDDLTFFADFGPASGPGRSIATGGVRPLDALAGDFNGDGLSDLVVVNNGDGLVSLLLGTPDGPGLERTYTALAHPSAVAPGEDPLVIYVSEEGEEVVASITLDFVVPSPSPTPAAPPVPIFPQDPGPGVPPGLMTPSREAVPAPREPAEEPKPIPVVVLPGVLPPVPAPVEGPGAAPAPVPPEAVPPVPVRPTTSSAPDQEPGLAPVAVLLPVTGDAGSAPGDRAEARGAVPAAGPSGAVLLVPSRPTTPSGPDSGDAEETGPDDPARERQLPDRNAATSPATSLPGFVLGLDEALRQSSAELRESLFPPAQPAPAAEPLDPSPDEVRAPLPSALQQEVQGWVRLLAENLEGVLRDQVIPVRTVSEGPEKNTDVLVAAEPEALHPFATDPPEEVADPVAAGPAPSPEPASGQGPVERYRILEEALSTALVACGAYFSLAARAEPTRPMPKLDPLRRKLSEWN